jgi:nucleoside-diphosphate-sugar epimerase
VKIVITGVRGFLGADLARRFLQHGHEVVGISRAQPIGLGLSAFFALGLGEAAPKEAFGGADLIIHAAHDRGAGAQNLNVEGTKLWAEQGRRHGAARQLFITSVSAHPQAPSEYGRAKAMLETYFSDIGALLVRPGLVVGGGGTFGDMTRMIRRYPALPILGGDSLKVVLTDLDSLFETAARFPSLVPGRSYNLFQGEWVGLLSLSREIRRYFTRKTLLIPVPLSLSLGLLTLGQKLGAPTTLGPESLKNLEHCRDYGYESSYDELGLPLRSLEEMLRGAFPPQA